MGFPPQDSHACCTPWSVFQDGSDKFRTAGFTQKTAGSFEIHLETLSIYRCIESATPCFSYHDECSRGSVRDHAVDS